MHTITPAAAVADALRSAAECFRHEDPENRALEHLGRASRAMARHGMVAELQGQVQSVVSFNYLGLRDRAAEVSDGIADRVLAIYA